MAGRDPDSFGFATDRNYVGLASHLEVMIGHFVFRARRSGDRRIKPSARHFESNIGTSEPCHSSAFSMLSGRQRRIWNKSRLWVLFRLTEAGYDGSRGRGGIAKRLRLTVDRL